MQQAGPDLHLHVVPPLCPMPVSTYDFSSVAELIAQAETSTPRHARPNAVRTVLEYKRRRRLPQCAQWHAAALTAATIVSTLGARESSPSAPA